MAKFRKFVIGMAVIGGAATAAYTYLKKNKTDAELADMDGCTCSTCNSKYVPLKEKLSQAAESAGEFAHKAKETVKDTFDSFVNKAGDSSKTAMYHAEHAMDTVGEAARDAVDTAGDWTHDAVDTVKETARDAAEAFKDHEDHDSDTSFEL